MDFERIKQNLRLRSGRTKKARKANPLTHGSLQRQPAPASTNSNPQNSQKAPATPQARTGTSQPTTAIKQETKPQQKQDKENTIRNSQKADSGASSPLVNGTAVEPRRHADQKQPTESNHIEDSQEVEYSGSPDPSDPAKDPSRKADKKSEQVMADDSSDVQDYDLRPPARRPKAPSLENLSELLFSDEHLNTILHDPQLLYRFTGFLSRYKSDLNPILTRYLDIQKAVKAVEYANAVAAAIDPLPQGESDDKQVAESAATIDDSFASASRSSFESLVTEALPAYITYSLVKVVTECLTNEITGKSTPVMRDLVGGLSEVFCLTNPKEEDNPIIYASEEFYRLTGYDSDAVIGNNCRFLQGPKTKRDAPRRLREAQDKVTQSCETLLNYRRDGRAFVNLLMTAPLLDNKEEVKYFIGAQVDVSRLVEGGRGLEAFEKLISQRERQKRGRPRRSENNLERKKEDALAKLRELSEMFDLEEAAVVRSHSRSNSRSRDEDSMSRERPRAARRVITDDDPEDEEDNSMNEEEKASWSLASSGVSGRLPGVYEKYMLIRPAPSLRIIFVSSRLKSLGDVVQSPFLSHVAASSKTLSGLRESFESVVPVTAKIGFMPNRGKSRNGLSTDQLGRNGDAAEAAKSAKTCWLSATPLLDGDGQIGVWMMVIVEKGRATSKSVNQASDPSASTITTPDKNSSKMTNAAEGNDQSEESKKEDMPIKPRRLESSNAVPQATSDASASQDHADEQDNHFEPVPKSDGGFGTATLDAVSPPPTKQQQDDQHHVDGDDVFVDRSEPQTSAKQNVDNVSSGRNEEDHSEKQSSTTAARETNDEERYDLNARPESPREEDQETIRSPSPTDEDRGDDSNDTFNLTPTVSRPQSSRGPGPESNSARPTGMLYMDYLRHPGSSGQKGSAMPSNGHYDDPDCVRSPYSVD